MRRWIGRHYISFMAVIMLLAAVITTTGCQDFGTFPTPEPPAQQPEKPVSTTFINSGDRAVIAVYEHLLSLAESHEAKDYLAEFSAVSDNWSANSELFKDGSSVWYVAVDMSTVENWQEKPYWQQASWFVYQDGRVIPSNRLQANALRIESDLQELSSPPPEE
ncbi:MAG TPA: hypothetical protein VFF92_00660 [Dehalococcoidales bacterium]|nr:hypothetical protein [Dehalococcoidales bacterium]